MTSESAHEFVDVVDDDDRVISTVTRAEMRARRLHHRTVSIAVVGTDGRLLVHRRAPDKDVWPGLWDIAAGGVVSAGEGYDAAARRELAEELGIVDANLMALGGGRFSDDDVSLVARCYLTVHDGPFVFADGEITETRWVTRDELTRLMDEERFVPDNLAVLLPLLRMD